jgi:hypothetical protein
MLCARWDLGFRESHAMACKIFIYSLSAEGTVPIRIGSMIATEVESYADLRVRLEQFQVVPWSFQFWDLEEGCSSGVNSN